MLTRMSEDEWATVKLFRACRSRLQAGTTAVSLEALHCFTPHNITWRALPAACYPLLFWSAMRLNVRAAGPTSGHPSRKRPSAASVPTRPFDQKIASDPRDKIIDWRKASSALSPSTMASTRGAIG